MRIKKISIIVPVFNEIATIEKIYYNLINFDFKREKEVIIVDDASTDGTREFLKRKIKGAPSFVKILFNKKNQGKGATFKKGLAIATGDYLIPQDADLEYNPKEIIHLVEKAEKEDLLVVYGSRDRGIKNRYLYPHYYYGAKLLNIIFNILYKQNVTDLETCYKLVDRNLLNFIDISESGFGLEAELTAKIGMIGVPIREVSISYKARSFGEGKKIKIKDGIRALYLIVKFFFSDLHYGLVDNLIRFLRKGQALSELRLSRNDTILDVGCGRQAVLGWEIRHKIKSYVGVDLEVSDVNIRNISLIQSDAGKLGNLFPKKSFDKIVALAVIEHLTSPNKFLSDCFKLLKNRGSLIITTPDPASKPILEVLARLKIIDPKEIKDHKTYFAPKRLINLMKDAGFNKTLHKSFLLGFNGLFVATKNV
ncbi:glycosyltransferase [Candidatus Woesebacteria bacterium]|nr:glycosyltransferase [Candidatus Woesebacteria bacterium]